jgi:hypothetical protein
VLTAKTRKLELPSKVLPIILLEDALNLETALQTALLGARKGALVLVPRALQSDREREAVILESFGFSQARTLLESLCGPQPIGLVKPWFERSLGNAAILAEVARLFNKGIDDTLELQNRLKTFALNHFEVFSSAASEVFSVAALFGSGFYLGGLSQVLGRDVSPDLEILVKDGVILESSATRIPGEREFRIQIPLLREAAISVFELQHRVSLHLAIASWFSSRSSSRARDHTRAAQSLQAALQTQTPQEGSAVGAKNKKTTLVRVSRASKSPKQN